MFDGCGVWFEMLCYVGLVSWWVVNSVVFIYFNVVCVWLLLCVLSLFVLWVCVFAAIGYSGAVFDCCFELLVWVIQ